MLKPVLIPPDCPTHQASQYITASLSQVYKTADEIFKRIDSRLEKCKENAENIQKRILIVDEKVKALKNTENVVLTHRTRYPDSKLNTLNALFDEENFSENTLKIDDLLFVGDSITNQTLKDAITRKKDFSYAFSKGKHFDNFKRANFKDKFNDSTRCELLDEEMIFSEKGKLAKRKDKFDFEAESLLIYDSIGKGFEADPIAYKPGFGALNAFNFPDVLPHLSGVTSSTTFIEGGGDFQSIAPSLRNETTVKEVKIDSTPSKLIVSSESQSIAEPIKPEKAPEPELPEILPIISAPVPPAPTIVPPQLSTTVPTPTVPAPISVSSPPPPPPPPPPPSQPLMQSLPKLPDLNKGRFDLMEAIRTAGGIKNAKLKTISSTEKNPQSSPSPKSAATDDTGDDLMSSLAKALETRRKGMAGNSSKKLQRLENKKNSSSSRSGPSEAFSRLRESLPVIPNEDGHHSDENNADWK